MSLSLSLSLSDWITIDDTQKPDTSEKKRKQTGMMALGLVPAMMVMMMMIFADRLFLSVGDVCLDSAAVT